MKTTNSRQDGFVSIIVALVIMIFVSLVALGFAFLARQNQEQNQNRQLSTQAFYAAESGVNDTVKYMLDRFKNTGVLPNDANSCQDGKNALSSAGYVSNLGGSTGNNEIEYTCALFQSAPRSLEYTVNDTSKVIPIQNKSGNNLVSITVSWQDDGGNTTFANNNSHWLPQAGTGVGGGNNLAANTGIVRATIIPVFSPMTKDDLLNKTQTVFLYPKVGDKDDVNSQPFIGSNSSTDAAQGVWVDGNCNTGKTPRYCSARITNLGAQGGTSKFYLRLRGIYRSSKVTITAREAGSDQDVQLANAQALVDVTGKANNVLRRIQVRVPFTANYDRPEFAIESMDSICKRLVSYPTTAGGPGDTIVDLPNGVSSSDPAVDACSLD